MLKTFFATFLNRTYILNPNISVWLANGEAKIFSQLRCRGVFWTHVSRVAPDWDLWRTPYRLSYRAAAGAQKSADSPECLHRRRRFPLLWRLREKWFPDRRPGRSAECSEPGKEVHPDHGRWKALIWKIDPISWKLLHVQIIWLLCFKCSKHTILIPSQIWGHVIPLPISRCWQSKHESTAAMAKTSGE